MSDHLNPEDTSSSESLLRRLRIDEIKERRRRFHKETAERWILNQQFGDDSSSTTSTSTSTSSFSKELQFHKSFSSPIVANSSNASIESENSMNNRTLLSPDVDEDEDYTDIPANGGSKPLISPTVKPLCDRNSFLNAFEFFAKGASSTSPPAVGEKSPPGGENVPIPKPRFLRNSPVTSPTSENKSFIKTENDSHRNGVDAEGVVGVRSAVLKFQEGLSSGPAGPELQRSPPTSPTSPTLPLDDLVRSSSDGRNANVDGAGGGGATKSSRLRTCLKLDLDGGGRRESFPNDGRRSKSPPVPEGSVSRRVGLFLRRQSEGNGNGGDREIDEKKFEPDLKSGRQRRVWSSSSGATPFVTLHSPPARISNLSPTQGSRLSPEDEDNSKSSSTSSNYNSRSNPGTVDEIETPSSSPADSSSDAQNTPGGDINIEGKLPPPPPTSSPPSSSLHDPTRKRPSIPDILVLDPIVIITDDGSSISNSTPTTNPVSRRRPSSILKKRDSAADDNSAPNGTTVSFACVDPKYDDEDEDYNDRVHREDNDNLCIGSESPYRRRSRSYSGSSSGASGAGGTSGGGRVGKNCRRRNSAEAPYYSSSEEFHEPSPSSKGILKHSCSSLSVDGGTSSSGGGAHSDSEFKSILKQPALRRSSLGSNIHTVHQTRFSDDYDFDDDPHSTSSHTPGNHTGQRSILKRKSSTSSSQPDVSTASSLRSTASSYCSSRESLHEPGSDPKPILKKKSSSEEISDSDYNSTSITPPPPRPILKNKRSNTATSLDSNYSSESIPILVRSTDPQHPIKPCLKKPCKSFDESTLWSNQSHNNQHGLESTSSIMRKSSPHICSVKKCEEDYSNRGEEEEVNGDREQREPEVKLKNSVLFARRDSEPLTSPTMEESSVFAARRGSGETFRFKRKIELGKIDFSGVYEGGGSKLSPPPTLTTTSSNDSSPTSGISSPTATPTITTTSSTSPKKVTSQGNVITQKIAALQISGESSWKKRVSKPNPEDEIIDGVATGENEPVEQPKKPERRTQNGILANRLSMLESSQESWRKRVGEKDAKEFTVQGKLERAGKKIVDSSGGGSSEEKECNSPPAVPSPSKKKSTASSFKNVIRGMRGSKTDESIGAKASSGSGKAHFVTIAVKEDDGGNSNKSSIFQRSKSMRYGRVSAQSPTPNQICSTSPTNETSSTQHVTIPVIKNDNETFTQFFQSAKNPIESSAQRSVIVEEDSFKSIICPENARQLLGNKRQVKVARKKERGVKNPIKALAGRIDLQQQSYTDLNPEIRETENIRTRIRMENSKSSAHSHLSIEALAGLASKEDFTSVKLRRAQQEISAQYPYPLLIRVKGKRFVQSRLAAPEISSLNSGDNFILITQTKLYHFIGEYSNRMERSKSLDIVAHVLQKKEFGCNLHTKVITLTEENGAGSGTGWDSFFEVIGCTGRDSRRIRDDPELLGDEADEAYEGKVIARNKVWKVITGDEMDEKLIPLREFWGVVPKHCLLESTEVLIFDFGGEMYVWSGSKAPFDKKRLGYRLAQEIFEMEGLGKEFDDVKGTSGLKGKDKDGVRRPSWCWLRKVNQHMEPILFIEKFFDWPEEVGRIRVGKNSPKKPGTENGAGTANIFIPCDAVGLSKSYYEEAPDISLILEGFDVRRGRSSSDKEEKRNYSISTAKLQTWAISEFSKSELSESQLGHFNATGTYVIRWQYTISFVGKDLRGNQSRHNASTLGGRDRCAYFFWHGKRSKITEQGASALMTVELDDLEEKGGSGGGASSRGPQIRVEQNYEPPAFLSLFNGKMFIHDSQANVEVTGGKGKSSGRLYATLGIEEGEIHFMEVACCLSSLRSNGVFLLFDVEHRVVYVWSGSGSSSEVKKFAVAGANYILKNPNWSPSPTKVVTLKQSQETDAFWSCLYGGGSKKELAKWISLQNCQAPVEMFRFTSINGKFEAIPVISPRRIAGTIETFPIVQEDLYGANVSQPSMFLILSPDKTLYLWQGWRRIIKREFVPEEEVQDISQQAVDSIPLTTIWPKYRRCCVDTSLNYARLKQIKYCYLVHAGLEPTEFTQIFPYWDNYFPAVKEAHDYHLAEGKKFGEKVELTKVLEELTAKRTYTVEELLEKPEGVDLSRLEDYVSDADFQRLFSMPRTQFATLHAWRKAELKKSVGLF